MKLSLIVIKFLFIGALFIVSTQNLYLSDSDDFDKFVGIYTSWLSNLFDNAKAITGYVVKSEWLPNDSTDIGSKVLRNSGLFGDS
ncbi:hypothetical protein CMI45_02255 [Candidatus Pacearchaeota archaeon]|nr:hypothetical protein [Candidatus Pacearchaeota archaeon]|tara:strand:+ start:583 stop:837 length:255 start_codon:yes stop_codon:yes gene_type:complete